MAVLGDSVTEGFGLSAEQAFPRELERQLEADGERVDVLNVAVRGWSTRQQRIAYHRIARRYRPDQAWSPYCLNDIPELARELRSPPQLLRALHRHSAFVRRVVDAAHREQAQVEDLFAGRPDLTAYFAELGRLRREVEQDGAEFTVAVLPYRFQFEPGAPPPSVQSEITAWCAAESLRCLDLRPALDPLGPAAFVDENHLSREGSAAVAAALRALLPRRSMAEALGDALAERPTPASQAARRWLAASRPALAPAERRCVREALVAALGAPFPRARAGAARALGSLLPEAGSEAALRAALGDPSEAVVESAAHALRARGLGRDDRRTVADAFAPRAGRTLGGGRRSRHTRGAARLAAALSYALALRTATCATSRRSRSGSSARRTQLSRASWCGWWARPTTTTRPGSPTRSHGSGPCAARRCRSSCARSETASRPRALLPHERSGSSRRTRRFPRWPARFTTTRPACARRPRSRWRGSARRRRAACTARGAAGRRSLGP